MHESVVYLCTRNDRDGNPRRGWLFTYEGGQEFIFDGVHGVELLDASGRAEAAHYAPRINVTVREFDRLLRRR